jgi:ABC-2 type transport system ATP-binding protein
VHFAGGLEEQAELLAQLIRDGFRVVSLTETSLDLEDVFMQITRGEVS